MLILTQGDLDGLASSVLLTSAERISEIRFALPRDLQDGRVLVTAEDILVDLPFVRGCGMWFYHRLSGEQDLPGIGPFRGKYADAPSAARVISEYYARPEFSRFEGLVAAADKWDSNALTREEILKPRGWFGVALTLDTRRGFSKEFQKYFRWLVAAARDMTLDRLEAQPEVRARVERALAEQEEFRRLLQKRSRASGGVVVTDLRDVRVAPAGNRCLSFALFPKARVEVRVAAGPDRRSTIVSVEQSIFNRSARLDVGTFLGRYGGGGNRRGGACRWTEADTDARLRELVARLKENL